MDIAVALLPYGSSEQRRLKLLIITICFSERYAYAYGHEMKKEEEEIGLGSEVFVLGFPMGIAGVREKLPDCSGWYYCQV